MKYVLNLNRVHASSNNKWNINLYNISCKINLSNIACEITIEKRNA